MQISWDVYNWLFEKDNNDKHVVFMSRFEIGDECKEKEGNSLGGKNEKRMSNWDEGEEKYF